MSDTILSSPPGEQIHLVINKMTEDQYQQLVEVSADMLSTELSNEIFLTYSGSGEESGGGGIPLTDYVATSALTGFITDIDAHNYQIRLSSNGAYVNIPMEQGLNGNTTYPLVDLGSGGTVTLSNASVNKLSADSTHSIMMTLPAAERGAATLRDMVAVIYGYPDGATTAISASGTDMTLYSDDSTLFSGGIVSGAVAVFMFSEIDTNKFVVARKDLVAL